MASQRRVKLFLNDSKSTEPRLMLVPPTYEEFLAQAGKKLGLKKARFAYTAAGTELNNERLASISDDEDVYVGEKEGFYKNAGKPGTYKIALLGTGGVGKSCVTLKYTRGAFTDIYDPSIEDAHRHHTTVDSVPCVLEILDTAGQEEYKCIAQQWVKNKHGFLLVYSIVDDISFQNLKAFRDLMEEEYLHNETDPAGALPPVVLIGNKLDMEDQRKVPTSHGQALADQWGAKFFETSAKMNDNIEKSFSTLIRMMRQRDRRLSGEEQEIASSGGGLFGCTLL